MSSSWCLNRMLLIVFDNSTIQRPLIVKGSRFLPSETIWCFHHLFLGLIQWSSHWHCSQAIWQGLLLSLDQNCPGSWLNALMSLEILEENVYNPSNHCCSTAAIIDFKFGVMCLQNFTFFAFHCFGQKSFMNRQKGNKYGVETSWPCSTTIFGMEVWKDFFCPVHWSDMVCNRFQFSLHLFRGPSFPGRPLAILRPLRSLLAPWIVKNRKFFKELNL